MLIRWAKAGLRPRSVVVTIATPSGIVAAETARYLAQSVRWARVRRWARGCMPPPKRLCAPATSAFGPLPAGNPLYPSLPMGLAPASLGDPGPAGAGKRRTPLPGRCRARIASRSEERRVGKECRCRGAAEEEREKRRRHKESDCT